MLERELKFFIPPAQREGVAHAIQALNATTLTLHACYFDTEQSDLAQNRIALRLRQEGPQWMQTIKAPGPDKITHIELNHPRPDASLDLSVYKDSAIDTILSNMKTGLIMRYETVMSRQVLTLNHKDSKIELAYDQGIIRSGKQQTQVCELEFEQLDGGVDDLFNLAKQWLQRHALVLDFRSKAARGNTLANHLNLHQPTETLNMATGVNPSHGTHAYLQSANACLAYIVAYANLLAGSEGPVSNNTANNYLHQISLGAHHLRTQAPRFSPQVDIIEKHMADSPTLQPALLDILHSLVTMAERHKT